MFDVPDEEVEGEYWDDMSGEPLEPDLVKLARDAEMKEFKDKAITNLALDGGERLAYLAPSMVNLNLTMERWPDITFSATREHSI